MKMNGTGIQELDRLLGGGLTSDWGYMITGPLHSGKRLLALTIQIQSLRRGEYCLYVSYGHSYQTVMGYYREMGVDPLEYMKKGQLKITDYFSAAQYSEDEIAQDLPPEVQEGVFFLHPKDLETEKMRVYMEKQKEWIKETGTAGVVIIDSLTDRLKVTGGDIVVGQFQRFRDKLTKGAQLCALHLYTPLDKEKERQVAEILNFYEDGTIELDYLPTGERRIRLRMRIPPAIDNAWHEFRITDNRILMGEQIQEFKSKAQAGLIVSTPGRKAKRHSVDWLGAIGEGVVTLAGPLGAPLKVLLEIRKDQKKAFNDLAESASEQVEEVKTRDIQVIFEKNLGQELKLFGDKSRLHPSYVSRVFKAMLGIIRLSGRRFENREAVVEFISEMGKVILERLEGDIKELRDALAHYFPEQPIIIQMLKDAGIKPEEIDLSGSAVNKWDAVLSQLRGRFAVHTIMLIYDAHQRKPSVDIFKEMLSP